MYLHLERSDRARQNEQYIYEECLRFWLPPHTLSEDASVLVDGAEGRDPRQASFITWLPYADFVKSARCLDDKRLAKQRIEAYQILRAIRGDYPLSIAWQNHRVTRMWEPHTSYLQRYYNEMVIEWIARGYTTEMGTVRPYDSIRPTDEASFFVQHVDRGGYPPWLGTPALHASHRARLLAEDSGWYSQFGWTEEPSIEVWWPI